MDSFFVADGLVYWLNDAVVESFVQVFTCVTSVYGVVMFFRNYFSRTVRLSIGSFKIKRKYYDVQNITNIVSVKFYDGGQIPPEIRREILELTCPDIKELSVFDNHSIY